MAVNPLMKLALGLAQSPALQIAGAALTAMQMGEAVSKTGIANDLVQFGKDLLGVGPAPQPNVGGNSGCALCHGAHKLAVGFYESLNTDTGAIPPPPDPAHYATDSGMDMVRFQNDLMAWQEEARFQGQQGGWQQAQPQPQRQLRAQPQPQRQLRAQPQPRRHIETHRHTARRVLDRVEASLRRRVADLKSRLDKSHDQIDRMRAQEQMDQLLQQQNQAAFISQQLASRSDDAAMQMMQGLIAAAKNTPQQIYTMLAQLPTPAQGPWGGPVQQPQVVVVPPGPASPAPEVIVVPQQASAQPQVVVVPGGGGGGFGMESFGTEEDFGFDEFGVDGVRPEDLDDALELHAIATDEDLDLESSGTCAGGCPTGL